MSTFRQTIEAQANQFAQAIVQAFRSASLDELLTITGGAGREVSRGAAAPKTRAAAPKKKGGRLGRRSPTDITRILENIVAVLAAHPEGLRAEQIKEALGLDKREMPKPIAEGLSTGALKKTGQKRATVYTVATGGAGPKKRAKKSRA
jgi:hypothetical protein